MSKNFEPSTNGAVPIKPQDSDAAFGHPRDYWSNRFVYALISQRARGLSLGINLTPDKQCSFDCVYCEINRDKPGRDQKIDLGVMEAELAGLLKMVGQNRMREIPWFRNLPAELLELKEVALSGEGEPTLCPEFTEVVEKVVHLRAKAMTPFKIVLITNTSGLGSPEVQRGLKQFASRDEVWVKLDAGTQNYMNQVNHPSITLKEVLANILTLGRERPVVIQSLFPLISGDEPSEQEIEQYVQRLLELKTAGAQISLVQIYSAHRPPHRPECAHLSLKTLSAIARRVNRVTGLRAEVF